MTQDIKPVETLPSPFDWAAAARTIRENPGQWHQARVGREAALTAAAQRMKKSDDREMPAAEGWKITVRKLAGNRPAKESHAMFIAYDPDGVL